MKKYKLFCIILLGIIVFLSAKKPKQVNVAVWIADTTDWHSLKFEVMEVEFNDGVKWAYTNREKASVSYGNHHYFRYLIYVVFKREMSDIRSMTHNHLDWGNGDEHRFSRADKKLYKALRRMGFKGKWQLWYGGRIYEYKEK